MIFDAQCPHCSERDIVPVSQIGELMRCKKCERKYPICPKAGTITDALLAKISGQMSQYHSEYVELNKAALIRLEKIQFWVFFMGLVTLIGIVTTAISLVLGMGKVVR
jgi:hypothetical protein